MEDVDIQNPFPSPPSLYKQYTDENLSLLAALRKIRPEGDVSEQEQRDALADQKNVPDWPLVQLEKPRADWIIEDGGYTAFGETWLIPERHQSLAELGEKQLYPEDPSIDRRSHLLSLLRTMLQSHHALVGALLSPPALDLGPEEPGDWKRYVDWMQLAGANMMFAVNELRPVQARLTLETMMTRQIELRREETKAINDKCDAMEKLLNELKGRATEFRPQEDENMNVDGSSSHSGLVPVTVDDVFAWSDEVQ